MARMDLVLRPLTSARLCTVWRDVKDSQAGLARGLRAEVADVGHRLFGRGPQAAGREPARPALPSTLAIMGDIWPSQDYRRQFWARLAIQGAQGIYTGASVALLSRHASSLKGSNLQMLQELLRLAETLTFCLTNISRARVQVTTGTRSRAVKPARHQLVSSLLFSWAGEVALTGCFFGLVACRGARWLSAGRLGLLLALLRTLRFACQQSQYGSLDGLKNLSGPASIRAKIDENAPITRSVEMTAGIMVQTAAGLITQGLPLVLPAASMTGALLGLSVIGLGVSLLTKLPLCSYLDDTA